MIGAMSPFDQPPSGLPVPLDPPSGTGPGGHDGPRRGRMALAALAAAGLVGGGIVVAGQIVSADRPTLGEQSTEEGDETPGGEVGGERADGDPGRLPIDGEIVIDDGDGDPLVLDLGALAECLGPILHGGPLAGGDGSPRPLFDEDFQQRMEDFLDGLPHDGPDGHAADDGVRIFGSGGSTVMVVGPDGVEVIDLGDGDATVTVEQRGGELAVETDGDATVAELPEFGDLLPHPHGDMPGAWGGGLPFDLGSIEECLGEPDGTETDGP